MDAATPSNALILYTPLDADNNPILLFVSPPPSTIDGLTSALPPPSPFKPTSMRPSTSNPTSNSATTTTHKSPSTLQPKSPKTKPLSLKTTQSSIQSHKSTSSSTPSPSKAPPPASPLPKSTSTKRQRRVPIPLSPVAPASPPKPRKPKAPPPHRSKHIPLRQIPKPPHHIDLTDHPCPIEGEPSTKPSSSSNPSPITPPPIPIPTPLPPSPPSPPIVPVLEKPVQFHTHYTRTSIKSDSMEYGCVRVKDVQVDSMGNSMGSVNLDKFYASDSSLDTDYEAPITPSTVSESLDEDAPPSPPSSPPQTRRRART